MHPSEESRALKAESPTSRERIFVIIWAVGLGLVFMAAGYVGARKLEGFKRETELSREAYTRAPTTDLDSALPVAGPASGARPTEVLVGVRINQIADIEVDKSGWRADFDIWFRWTGDAVRPGEHFRVINSDIELRELQESFADGELHYERYNIRARLVFNVDPRRYPFSDQSMGIQIEDVEDGVDRLRYVPDEAGSGVDPRAMPASLKVIRTVSLVKLHDHPSRRGDPRLAEGQRDVHSRFIFAFLIAPPGWALYAKLFQALFASVAIALVVFFIKPMQVDPRFGLGVGAFFSAVGNNIFVQSSLPPIAGLGLPDMVNGVGLATIFLSLVQSTMSLYIEDTRGREKLRRLFDHVSFAVFLAGYVTVNLVLILAARS